MGGVLNYCSKVKITFRNKVTNTGLRAIITVTMVPDSARGKLLIESVSDKPSLLCDCGRLLHVQGVAGCSGTEAETIDHQSKGSCAIYA